jgi:type II secretory pathway component PulF
VQSIGYASSTPLDTLGASAPRVKSAERAHDVAPGLAGESREQAALRTHVANILDRGRNITPALRAYADELPAGRQRRQLLAVCRVLTRGSESEATSALAALPEYWIPLLSAATSSSDPGHMLSEFLSESQRTDQLRHQWWLALAYPIVLAGLALMVMLGLSVFVIPQFASIFLEFDLELPPLTSWILNIAAWLASWGGLILALLGGMLVVLLLNANRLIPKPIVAWLSDWIRPPFGRRASVARFARFLADLLEADVELPDALRIAGHSIQRARMQRAAWRLANEIERDKGQSSRVFERPLSASVYQAISADMTTAARVHLLREISSAHADRVRIGLSWTSGLIEPAAIVLVGFVIGAIVLGLFLPLVRLVEGLSG